MPPILPYRLFNEDCFAAMERIPAGSVDMVLADLPYGTTQCKWDTVLPLDRLWAAYKRVCKPNAAIVLTASQPFTSALVMSNPKDFKYEWIWEKSKASNFLDAKKKPLKAHESVVVFYQAAPTYNPQKVAGKPFKGEGRSKKGSETLLVGKVPNPTFRNDNNGDRYPRSVQYFKTAENEGCFSPTQKPVALMEYFVKTYTNPNELVLDNCMGSGTTGVACMNLGRRFIGCDNDKEHGYFEIATKRIKEAYLAQNH